MNQNTFISKLNEIQSIQNKMSQITRQSVGPVQFTEILFRMGVYPGLEDLNGTVCIKKSSIPNGGNGVFTTKRINKGEIITFYPCHAMIDARQLKNCAGKVKIKKKLPFDLPSNQNDIMDYSTAVYEGEAYYYGSPEITDSHSLGHMINDASSNETIEKLKNLNDFCKKNKRNTKKCSKERFICMLSYYLDAKKKSNCSIISSGAWCFIQATKTIEKDVELFTDYGPEYWYKGSPQELLDTLSSHSNKKQLKILHNLMTDIWKFKYQWKKNHV